MFWEAESLPYYVTIGERFWAVVVLVIFFFFFFPNNCHCSRSSPGSGDSCGTVSPVAGGFMWQGSDGGHGGELQPAHRAVLQLWSTVYLQGWVGETQLSSHGLLSRQSFEFWSRERHLCKVLRKTQERKQINESMEIQCGWESCYQCSG